MIIYKRIPKHHSVQRRQILTDCSIIILFPINLMSPYNNTMVLDTMLTIYLKGSFDLSLNQCVVDVSLLGYQSLQGPALSSFCCPSLLWICSHLFVHFLETLGFFQFFEWTQFLPTLEMLFLLPGIVLLTSSHGYHLHIL